MNSLTFKINRILSVLAIVGLSGCEPITPLKAHPTKSTHVKIPDYTVQNHTVHTYSFEEDEFEGFEGNKSSQILINGTHHIDGNHALEWQWKHTDATLRLDTPLPYKKDFRPPSSPMNHASVFGAWIYNENAQEGAALRFSFGSGDSEHCSFDYGLNFNGWRLIAVKYDDMQGAPTADMDYLQVEAPAELVTGRIWLDQVQPVFYDDIRWQWPDYQTPFIPSRVPNQLYLNSDEARKLQAAPMNAADQKVISSLKEKTISDYGNAKFSESKYKSLKDDFSAHFISKTDTGIQGKTIDDIRAYLELMLEVARQYYSATGDAKKELERIYLLMSEHMLDQGWAEGSALNAQHHFGYKSRAWAPALLLMEGSLREHGLMDSMIRSLNWFGRDFLDYTLPFERYTEETRGALAGRLADYLNTFVNTHYISLLLLEPSAFQAYALNNFSNVLSESILWENGALKEDGSFFHHKLLYAGYAIPAINAMASVIYNLDGTPYEISVAAYARLKHSTLATELWGYPYWGYNACGRHPITGKITARGSYELIAVSAPETEAVDANLAQLCRRMFGEPSHAKLKAHDAPVESLSGFWSMNYAGSGIYKWKGQSVQMKGYGFGVRSHETYKKDNRFGRYGSHGSMLIFNENDAGTSAINYDGWDWSQPSGTTTLSLPLDILEGKAAAFYGWSPKQKTVFGGAGHLNQTYGAFGFGLDETKDNQSIKVRKSAFAVDSMLICLGSDLANTSTTYPLVTTLFQLGGKDEIKATRAFSSVDNAPNQKTANTETQTAWLIDTQGNGYLLPIGNDELILQRGLQQSMHDKTKAKTEGGFTKAWLNHGISPQGAAYEYIVKLGANEENMKALNHNVSGNNKFYDVLHQNENCHAIRTIKGLSFYVIFDALKNDSSARLQKGDLRSCDTPLIILSQTKDNKILLSITNPNPSLDRAYDETAPLYNVTIELEGKYKVLRGDRVTDKTDATHTILDIQIEGSNANQILLQAQ
ncbi:MAG: chondroitinase family polysaccharide lyase [Lentimonas sp.]